MQADVDSPDLTLGGWCRAGGEPPGRADRAPILVVDDDRTNLRVMTAILDQLGYRYHLATDGREAVHAVQRNAYAAILMDCLMPGMDGYEATAWIREHEHRRGEPGGRRLPIIAVTAVALSGARERCLAAGMDDYLAKPVVVSSVADVLARWLAGAGGAGADETRGWMPEPQPDRAAPPDEILDRETLDELRALDPQSPQAGEALIADLVRDFTVEVSPCFRALRLAAASGDVARLQRTLHFIAGCASMVGATRVERLSRSLEGDDQPGAGPADVQAVLRDVVPLIDRLEAAFDEARGALDSLVAASAARGPLPVEDDCPA